MKSCRSPLPTKKFVDFDGNTDFIYLLFIILEWVTKLEKYTGLVQEFFFVPQIIGNFMWQVDTKPLRKVSL